MGGVERTGGVWVMWGVARGVIGVTDRESPACIASCWVEEVEAGVGMFGMCGSIGDQSEAGSVGADLDGAWGMEAWGVFEGDGDIVPDGAIFTGGVGGAGFGDGGSSSCVELEEAGGIGQ